jgi:hypothetical protein
MPRDDFEIVALHVMGTLPDSFQQRTQLLSSLISVLPRQHGQRRNASEMFNELAHHESMKRQRQAEFDAIIEQLTKEKK